MKRSPLKRSTPLKTTRWRRTVPGDAELRAAWFNSTGALCAIVTRTECDGPIDAHHVTSQEAIKRWARTLRLDAASLASVLWDTRNRLWLCRRHHDLHETAKLRVPRAALTASAIAFAHELGLEHLLDRYYPKEAASGTGAA